MSGFSLIDVQQGIYSLLKGNAFLLSKGWGVLDHVGEEDSLPYVVLEEADGDDISAKDRHGMAVRIELHFWSDQRGYKFLMEAMREAYNRLHMRSVLVVSTVHTVRCRVVMVKAIREPDGLRRHGIMRVEALTYGLHSVGTQDDESRMLEIPEDN